MVLGRAAIVVLLAGIPFAAGLCATNPGGDNAVPNIFQPQSTPADSIKQLSDFVLAITGMIFVVVFSLLIYAVIKFRQRAGTADRDSADRGS